jgi:hypothetical protein
VNCIFIDGVASCSKTPEAVQRRCSPLIRNTWSVTSQDCSPTAGFLFCVSWLRFLATAVKHVTKRRTRTTTSVLRRDRSRGRVIWSAHDRRSTGHFDSSFKSRSADGRASCEKRYTVMDRYLVKWGSSLWEMYLKLSKTVSWETGQKEFSWNNKL